MHLSVQEFLICYPLQYLHTLDNFDKNCQTRHFTELALSVYCIVDRIFTELLADTPR